ncbi:glutaminase A L-glutamine amidohydrolase [Talaromyces proteolyticus]|uniref:Glutaminase A L-glutamine amidohydrolase n=1 Tax=Talaromyces proteolyticus TaxID=1131652 RepID=A0AAD4KXD1_9EURO|nr:glutaminase A L-glutamine amidohydrolase [Talaromyces proteolyticus]KAH8701553.1 glutaminase A L-glutamine amidohydrolase [Talaromyces proteolyticus]
MGALNLVYSLTLATLPALSLAGTVSLPSYPLAVKSPYLSTWLPGNQTNDVATGQPEFWAGQKLNWPILARIGGTTYTLFGAPEGISGATAATTTAVSYTSTHTLFALAAGGVNITLDFFSPVYSGPDDYAKQSLPYSYLTVSASAHDATDIQILSGIDYTWTAQGGAAELNFTTTDTAGFFWFYNPNQHYFSEDSDMSTYGSVLYGTTTANSVSYSCNDANTIYATFGSTGALGNPKTCEGGQLAALAKDLGRVTTANVTFAVGFQRDLAINYLGNPQTGAHRSNPNWYLIPDAIGSFLTDYENAVGASSSFDEAVRSKSKNVSIDWGSQYADIIEASVRQTFGSFEITVPLANLTESPHMFLKEISSDGNIQTIDVMYQTWPVFISLNPEYIKLFLKPVLSYSATGAWPHPWVIHDLGTHYPNATGHNDGNAEQMPLFECSSLFILLQAYQKYTNDSSFAAGYTSILAGYADYLNKNSLYPASQLISVDAIPERANQTGLAIQSAIGLKAASFILGNSTYSDTAKTIAKTVYDDALGLDGETLAESTHFTYYYGESETWNVLFPSYSDVLLGLNTFNSSAWALQSDWYSKNMQVGGLAFAGPLNYTGYGGSRINWGLSDWNLLVAATSSADVQAAIVNTTHTFLTNGLNDIPFGTKYYVEGDEVGIWIANRARPTVGTNFALLALDQGYWGASF